MGSSSSQWVQVPVSVLDSFPSESHLTRAISTATLSNSNHYKVDDLDGNLLLVTIFPYQSSGSLQHLEWLLRSPCEGSRQLPPWTTTCASLSSRNRQLPPSSLQTIKVTNVWDPPLGQLILLQKQIAWWSSQFTLQYEVEHLNDLASLQWCIVLHIKVLLGKVIPYVRIII